MNSYGPNGSRALPVKGLGNCIYRHTLESLCRDTPDIRTFCILNTCCVPNMISLYQFTPEMRTLLYAEHFTRSPRWQGVLHFREVPLYLSNKTDMNDAYPIMGLVNPFTGRDLLP